MVQLTCIQRRLSPNNHGALPILTTPPFLATPHFTPPSHPYKQFLDILYAILCNFMRVFSELWKLAVRDNDTTKMKKMGLVKHIAFVS